jgi:hypothetical protein
MAVDHLGTAYVVFTDGELFTVSTATAVCSSTTALAAIGGFTLPFGMGFTADPDGLGETLYLASTTSPGKLGTLDTSTFIIQAVGAFSPDIGEAELTGTGSGQLYGFGVVHGMQGANLASIDKGNATILSEVLVPTPENPASWAFGFWGGDFYLFTGSAVGGSTVGRYDPANASFDASYAVLRSGLIVGAGVSTCAPR